MRILVTGGAGFIGSHLVDYLLVTMAKDFELIVIDNLSTGKIENLQNLSRITFMKRDIRDFNSILPFFHGVDCVFHLAAMARIQPSIQNPEESHSNNVDGTFNVLRAIKEEGVKKIIYSASSSVYGDQDTLPLIETMTPKPKNPYAYFKLMGEQMCELFHKMYGIETVCLRYFNVYGERQPTEGAYATVIGKFLSMKKQGYRLSIVGDGEQRRDFTYVKDVARANVNAMLSQEAIGEVINIGSGVNYSVNEVAGMIKHKTIPVPERLGEARLTLADISKAERLLSWKPTVMLGDWLKKINK